MKVTKRGTENKCKWVGVCRHCKSEAEAEQAELTHITHDQREGAQFSWEVCPVCKEGDKTTGYGGMLFHLQTAE